MQRHLKALFLRLVGVLWFVGRLHEPSKGLSSLTLSNAQLRPYRAIAMIN